MNGSSVATGAAHSGMLVGEEEIKRRTGGYGFAASHDRSPRYAHLPEPQKAIRLHDLQTPGKLTDAQLLCTGAPALPHLYPHCDSTVVAVPRGKKVVCHAAALVTDLDETVVSGSGFNIHDGARGRLAEGLRAFVFECRMLQGFQAVLSNWGVNLRSYADGHALLKAWRAQVPNFFDKTNEQRRELVHRYLQQQTGLDIGRGDFNRIYDQYIECPKVHDLSRRLARDEFARDWEGCFKSCTGKSEADVLKGLAIKADEIFQLGIGRELGAGADLKNNPILEHLKSSVRRAWISGWKEMMGKDDAGRPKVGLHNGMPNLLSSASRLGIPVAGCTASGAEVMHVVLAVLGINHLFRHPGTQMVVRRGTQDGSPYERTDDVRHRLNLICGARKKEYCPETRGDAFNGIDMGKAFDMIGTHPSRGIVCGDTMSDVGAGILAGASVIVIRPSLLDEVNPLTGVQYTREEAFAAFAVKFEDFKRSIPEYRYNARLVLVEDFSQVDLCFEGTRTASFNIIDQESFAA